MKKTWKHINLEQRKLISSGIAHNDRLIEIAERLELDSRSISKEVRRNRIPIDYTKEYISKCPNFNRWSLVCTKCKLRYSKDCCYKKFKYDARTVQRKADANLINLRKGIDLDSEEFKKLDSIIKKGIDEKKSIYQIKTENNNIIDKSITTLYKYVNKDYLSTKRIDLPYTIKLKKENIIKRMIILIILIWTTCPTSINIQVSMPGNLISWGLSNLIVKIFIIYFAKCTLHNNWYYK